VSQPQQPMISGAMVGNLRSERGIASAVKVLEFDFMIQLDGWIRNPDGGWRRIQSYDSRVSTNLPAVEVGTKHVDPLSKE
jgi:hypothetical protein